jgi:hypothetical protein
MLTGAGLGALWLRHWGAAAVGLLLGLVIGLEIVRSWISKPSDPPGLPELTIRPGWIPWLSRLAWTGVIVAWGWALSAGWLQGEGAGLLLVLFILPVTAFFWLIGGPMVASASERVLQRIAAGDAPESDAKLARRGVIQSRIMTGAFLLLLLWILSRMFF